MWCDPRDTKGRADSGTDKPRLMGVPLLLGAQALEKARQGAQENVPPEFSDRRKLPGRTRTPLAAICTVRQLRVAERRPPLQRRRVPTGVRRGRSQSSQIPEPPCRLWPRNGKALRAAAGTPERPHSTPALGIRQQ